MKTKIVYSIVSDENDIFLEQALVSVYSLRFYNPNAIVILVVDNGTDATLQGNRGEILKYISEKVVVTPPKDLTKRQISRYIKTSLRQYIQGDYLFIDSDTIITASLEDCDNIKYPIAAVKDRHFTLHEHRCYGEILKYAKIINWNIKDSDLIYYNSGVFYVKDIEKTHEFYKMWHSIWLQSCKLGIDYDQPALGKTNSAFGNYIGEMNGIWNCQILSNGLPFLYGAKILHYFNSNLKEDLCFAFILSDKKIYKEIKQKGLSDDLKKMILSPHNQFITNCEIVGGKRLDFQYTDLYTLIWGLYTRCPNIYKLANKISKYMIKMILRK